MLTSIYDGCFNGSLRKTIREEPLVFSRGIMPVRQEGAAVASNPNSRQQIKMPLTTSCS
jgi:hypothetical protein